MHPRLRRHPIVVSWSCDCVCLLCELGYHCDAAACGFHRAGAEDDPVPPAVSDRGPTP